MEPTPEKKRKRKWSPPVRQDLGLIDVSRTFGTEEQCLGYLETMRWPEGVKCLKCGSDSISQCRTNETTRQTVDKKTGETKLRRVPARTIYQCLTCGHQFTPTTGTLFHDTHLDLTKWFQAVAIMCEGKKGGSALQLQRHLKIGSYKTAWYLNHRIRKALEEEPTGPLKGIVEVDETYVGGKFDKRRKRERWDKEPVFGIVERGGQVRTWHIPQVNRWHVISKLQESVEIEGTVYTDDSNLYHRMPDGLKHAIVNHSEKEWVRGEVHTGTIDGYWSLVKRGIIGSFHRISTKHLHRYLFEFEWRWNHRSQPDMFARVIGRLLIGTPLEYKALIADPLKAASSDPQPDA